MLSSGPGHDVENDFVSYSHDFSLFAKFPWIFKPCFSDPVRKEKSFDFFFEVSKFSGKIRNCEGDKCADMQYFTIDEIKNLKNVVSTTRISLENIVKGQIYSECRSYKSETR